MNKLNTVYKDMQEILSRNESCEPPFEANLLLEYVLGADRLTLGPSYRVSESDEKQLKQLCHRRAEGYPLQYILGTWQFFDLELEVGPGVLIPRRDTEDVCLAAFECLKDIPYPNVLDLCSGSGAIALATKRYFPDSTVVAVEKFPDAFEYLKKNTEKTGLQILPVMADVFQFDYVCDDESFDMIVSNPPYIDPRLEGKLQPEVSYEPSTALFAPEYGLRFYKFISKYYHHALKDGGYLVFEHGYDQAKDVENLILSNDYRIVKRIVDTAGNPRGIIRQKC